MGTDHGPEVRTVAPSCVVGLVQSVRLRLRTIRGEHLPTGLPQPFGCFGRREFAHGKAFELVVACSIKTMRRLVSVHDICGRPYYQDGVGKA